MDCFRNQHKKSSLSKNREKSVFTPTHHTTLSIPPLCNHSKTPLFIPLTEKTGISHFSVHPQKNFDPKNMKNHCFFPSLFPYNSCNPLKPLVLYHTFLYHSCNPSKHPLFITYGKISDFLLFSPSTKKFPSQKI